MAKRVVIVGAGLVGLTSAGRLSRDGHDVVIVERDDDLARELLDRMDVQVVAGNGSSINVLREARLDQADLLLAVTNSDEVNMITALVASTAFDVKTKVVRLRSDELTKNIDELSARWPGKTFAINPDRAASNRILSLLGVPHAADVTRLLGGRVVVAGFRIEKDCPLLGKSMATLRQIFPRERILIAAVYREGKALLPWGETELQVGDTAYFSTVPERVPEVVRVMGLSFDREERIVIGGSGHIGRMLARDIVGRGLATVIIRRDRAGAEKLAVELPSALVLHGPLDDAMLREAGVEKATSFIGATDDQETNLLSTVIARRLGASRQIALVDNSVYVSLADSLNIDAVVSPRLATVGQILRFVRGEHFEQVASLPDELVEIDVVEINERSPLVDRPIQDLRLPRGVLIAAIATDDEVIIPRGSDALTPGARAVLFTLRAVAEQVADIFEDRG